MQRIFEVASCLEEIANEMQRINLLEKYSSVASENRLFHQDSGLSAVLLLKLPSLLRGHIL